MLTQEQIKERIGYIGGSDAAAVCGVSRWATPLSVWAEKTGAIQREDISGNLPVRLGNKLEQTVAELFTEETGKKVQRVNETLFHPIHKFIGCNLDRRVVGEKSILECKTCSPWKAKEWEGDDFPAEYVIQVIHQLAVSGAQKGYLAVLIGNQDFKIKEIDRDEKVISDLIRRECEFWNFVETNTMPAATSKDKDAIAKLFKVADETKSIELGEDAQRIIDTLESLNQDSRSIENQIAKAQNELKLMLKYAERGITNTHTILWSNLKTTRLDVDSLKDQRPEVYEAFSKTNTTRRFLVKTNKGE